MKESKPGRIVITERKGRLLLMLFKNNRPELIKVAAAPDEQDSLGNIYIGRVRDIAGGIQAAFVSVSPEETVFLSLGSCKKVLMSNREYDGTIKQGDEILVQITKQPQKTKLAGAETKLTLTGSYSVCEYDGHGISCSKKLSKENAADIKREIEKAGIAGLKNYHFTIRTNAGELRDRTPLFEEMRRFISIFDGIKLQYKHRTCFSCLYKSEPEIISCLKSIPLNAYQEIITDSTYVYQLLKGSTENGLGSGLSVRLYEDSMLSLTSLYRLETHLKEALSSRVWLPGGGYLVIEPTEAMVVIDVNSGKSEAKSSKNSGYYYKINEEAAGEIARQLRLRNYSGMIMVDFINMETEEENKRLLSCLEEYLKQDLVKTRLVDMTALGIVEITRKKVSKPLDISIL